MSTCKLSGLLQKIYIKNNNLCKTISIILIHSFLLGINSNVSCLQRRTFKIKELMCKQITDILCESCIMHTRGAKAPITFFGGRGPPLLPTLPNAIRERVAQQGGATRWHKKVAQEGGAGLY